MSEEAGYSLAFGHGVRASPQSPTPEQEVPAHTSDHDAKEFIQDAQGKLISLVVSEQEI